MMKIISNTICLSVFSLVCPAIPFASLPSAYASLVDTSQNQTFESGPTHSFKLAAVHFITNDNALNFGNQEFLPADLCKQGGYTHEGCPAGYVKGDECPYDSKFVRDCIDPDTWCKNNGYNVTSCSVPKYPTTPCPYKSSLYKSCEPDNIRACKELGYSLTCETGKIGDSAQACPYNSSYKKCICNPCSGYDYTAAQASAQGYVPGEVCNSCGTIKYKRTENACDGYKACDCGGEAGAKICYSGSVQKFDTCKTCCDSNIYKYDSTNCNGNKIAWGCTCDKYTNCDERLKILYGDGSLSLYPVNGKRPIGIVFDEKKRLAVSLTLITKEGKAGHEAMSWGEYTDVPGLENCSAVPNVSDTCGTDGHKNTQAILDYATLTGRSFPAARAVSKFEPEGCTGKFCKAGNWFLPSAADFNKMEKLRGVVAQAMADLNLGWEGLSYYDGQSRAQHTNLWSSTEADRSHAAWVYFNSENCAAYGMGGTFPLDRASAYVRPAVKY